MSTTFEIYPTVAEIPTANTLLRAAEGNLVDFLASVGIARHVTLSAEVIKGDVRRPLTDDLLRCDRGAYIWISVPGLLGGTDGHFLPEPYDYEDPDFHPMDPVREGPAYRPDMEPLLDAALAVGHSWYFRRSAGQPGLIALTYGIVAATLANLTQGLVFTGDSAWDWDPFPALGHDMLGWYFRPETCRDAGRADWTRRCIADIRRVLGPDAG